MLPQPILVVTSEFGTVSMWDWEINSFLTAKGIKVIGPTSLEKTRQVCRALALRRQLKHSKLLVYQDNPAGIGSLQYEIFKRFYWWEPECVSALHDKFGLTVLKKSFKTLGEAAKAIPDEAAQKVWEQKKAQTPIGNLTQPGGAERGEALYGCQARPGPGSGYHRSRDELPERVDVFRHDPLPGLEFPL